MRVERVMVGSESESSESVVSSCSKSELVVSACSESGSSVEGLFGLFSVAASLGGEVCSLWAALPTGSLACTACVIILMVLDRGKP